MLCFDANHRLVWSDLRRRTVSVLSSDARTTKALLGWWQAAYRSQTAASRADRAALASRSLLRRRIAAAGTVLSTQGGSCSASSAVGRGTWSSGDDERGTLYCVPQDGDETYSWTVASARVYMTFVYAGGSERRAYETWARHLSFIGL